MDFLGTNKIVRVNSNKGIYLQGVAFSEAKWVIIIAKYREEMERHGKCSVRKLALICKISKKAASRGIKFAKDNKIELPMQGTPRRGVGSLLKLSYIQHRFIYNMYLNEPAATNEKYIDDFYKEFGFLLSASFMSKWFMGIGPFRGCFRTTSKFPLAKNTPRVLNLVREYLRIIMALKDHRVLVFADEKPMKQRDLFTLVRRDPFTGKVPHFATNSSTSKVRYNIFAAVTVKENVENNIDFFVLEERGDSFLFRAFVMHLIVEGTLKEGDVFVVDNCSIHFNGENKDLEKQLWEEFNILMIPLPPYHPELNPTEFVFAHLVMKLREKSVRVNATSEEEFVEMIENTIMEIPYGTVYNEYRHCGYLKN